MWLNPSISLRKNFPRELIFQRNEWRWQEPLFYTPFKHLTRTLTPQRNYQSGKQATTGSTCTATSANNLWMNSTTSKQLIRKSVFVFKKGKFSVEVEKLLSTLCLRLRKFGIVLLEVMDEKSMKENSETININLFYRKK